MTRFLLGYRVISHAFDEPGQIRCRDCLFVVAAHAECRRLGSGKAAKIDYHRGTCGDPSAATAKTSAAGRIPGKRDQA